MMKNNKGFTVVELVISFLFVTIICLSMYALIVNYKDRAIIESLKSELTTFQATLTIDIRKDIERKILKEIKNCSGHETTNDCIDLYFEDGTNKKLEILKEILTDVVGEETHSYTISYIVYGGIRYSIPDAKFVTVQDELLLNASTSEDALETKTTLYRIKINIKHQEIETPYVIRITVSGNKNIYTSGGTYTAYNIGDLVNVRVKSGIDIPFRVIRGSNAYNSYATLLYAGNYTSHGLSSNQFNTLVSDGNEYKESLIRDVLLNATSTWSNPKEVRLITAEELSFIIGSCPGNKKSDTSISLSINHPTQSWLYDVNYWTMTPVIDNQGQAWVVSSSNRSISASNVNIPYNIRPVIVIHKAFVN